MTEILLSAEVLVFVLAALGPAGLLGYVWKSSAWKTRTEERLSTAEKTVAELGDVKGRLSLIEKTQADLGRRDSSNMEMLQRIYEQVSEVKTDQRVQHTAVEAKITQGLAELETKLSEKSSAGRRELYAYINENLRPERKGRR